jgi:CheY-like chemotaxis protein
MWVLVIDDVPSNTIFITEALKTLEHRAVVCHDPIAGLALLDQMVVDCILVDYHMPCVNASAFMTALHAKLAPSGKTIPVVVMTADPSLALVENVKELGAATVLHKPLNIAVLGSALNSALTYSHSTHQANGSNE